MIAQALEALAPRYNLIMIDRGGADTENINQPSYAGFPRVNDMANQITNIFRILILQSGNIEVNMVYAEVGGEDYEVLGAFSGHSGAGGLFHQDQDGEVTVSDDPGDFSTKVSTEESEIIFSDIERLRSKFEKYDNDGNLLGLSEEGINFLKLFGGDLNGYSEVYSEGASEDFIYDIQDEWNLSFYKD